jgi:hypothetical protein
VKATPNIFLEKKEKFLRPEVSCCSDLDKGSWFPVWGDLFGFDSKYSSAADCFQEVSGDCLSGSENRSFWVIFSVSELVEFWFWSMRGYVARGTTRVICGCLPESSESPSLVCPKFPAPSSCRDFP